MMNITDRHCRVFLRLLSARSKLYTEMKVCDSILHGDRARMLDFDDSEHPLAIQLAGCEPKKLAAGARLAADAGYDEINLNVGCPSSRVRDGQFGACLMAKPDLVGDCVAAMGDAVARFSNPPPITVKTRIGIDAHDSYEYLAAFIARVAQGGCAHFIIHARKAWLQGLSPKQNREVPELDYARVYRLKKNFPDIAFTINGGITDIDQAALQLQYVDGVMVGRAACRRPWLLSAVDEVIYRDARRVENEMQVAAAYLPYIESQAKRGVPMRRLVQPMLGLFQGQAGARKWRRCLSEEAVHGGVAVIARALSAVPQMS